jgi:signal transduction histidine kinase
MTFVETQDRYATAAHAADRYPAIEIRDAVKTFGSVVAVDGVSLSIQPGEIVALLGPNGAGKTTTIDILLGLSRPTRGAVSVYGMSPRAAVARGLVSAVMQTGGLLKDYTVAETVRLTASLFASGRPVEELLDRAGIADIANRRVGACSGGQDLHDILGHSLTVITMKAELAGRLLDVDLDRARTELKDLENLSRDALADVRSTALGLRGVSLPGEIAAARAALDAAGVDADLPSVADEVPSRWRELFAWTIREAVTNVVRHSGASRATVRITPRSVEVLDNGRGQSAAASDTGQGLDGLRQRAMAAGAAIEVGDRPGGGFRVYVEVPA